MALVLVSCLWGCAHRRPDPFLYGPQTLQREKAKAPVCFNSPLAECVGDPAQHVYSLASPWRYRFHVDLQHRVCRGEHEARNRFLEGARQIDGDDRSGGLKPVYMGFLNGCSSSTMCEWVLSIAADDDEAIATRRLLLEVVRRNCDRVIDKQRFLRIAADLIAPLPDEPPWQNSTQQERCAELARPQDPWDDLTATNSAGCLDLGEWLDRHRADGPGAVEALARCVDRGEIRYREADCLRELAGLDRQRAVAFVRDHERRGWGIASNTNRYARTLLRFPETGRLEAELARIGLLPGEPAQSVEAGPAPVLANEILESQGRVLRFNPSCSVRYCEHAPLLYRLTRLVAPVLDDLLVVERWPARERIDLGSGPRAVSHRMGGHSVQLHVAAGDEPQTYDREHKEELLDGVRRAMAKPHEMQIYVDGKVYTLPIRNLGEWYDLEALLGALNTILAGLRSELRYVTLAPHCTPCAKVLAGPRNGLITAAFHGLIEVVDPLRELWTLRNFDSQLLNDSRVALAPEE